MDQRGPLVINAGGTLFHTTAATLSTVTYFKERLATWQTGGGELFVDVDPKHFRHILNWMRNPEYEFPEDEATNIVSTMRSIGIMLQKPVPKEKPVSNLITVNAGGTRYTVHGDMLKRCGVSIENYITESGETFIDVDPEHFRHILNWLRDRRHRFPEGMEDAINLSMLHIGIDRRTLHNVPCVEYGQSMRVERFEFTNIGMRWGHTNPLHCFNRRILSVVVTSISNTYRIKHQRTEIACFSTDECLIYFKPIGENLYSLRKKYLALLDGLKTLRGEVELDVSGKSECSVHITYDITDRGY